MCEMTERAFNASWPGDRHERPARKNRVGAILENSQGNGDSLPEAEPGGQPMRWEEREPPDTPRRVLRRPDMPAWAEWVAWGSPWDDSECNLFRKRPDTDTTGQVCGWRITPTLRLPYPRWNDKWRGNWWESLCEIVDDPVLVNFDPDAEA